jgi:hypothetical protein
LSAIPALPQVEGSVESPFRVYVNTDRLTFTEGEPVEITAEIKNYSMKTASFNTYDVNYTTFQPVVYSMDGKEAETTVKYRMMDRTVQDVVAYIEPRRSLVGHDEKVVKRLNIRDYYNLERVENTEFECSSCLMQKCPLLSEVRIR